MSQTLYRKYRPQTFTDVIDQNHIKITLQNEILSGQIAHAYLFTGPHGIGKTSLARILAKSLNCQNRKDNEFEPCNQCQSCKDIVSAKSLDLIEMDAATHTQVDKVRENIIENVRFAPYFGKYKIFIIDEVHMLSTAAFNALLKTLEEPPEYIVFILCTTEIYKLPETIISRCQRFDFKKISSHHIVDKLKKIVNQEKVNVEDEVLQTIAHRSGGFIRDSESLLGQVLALLSNGKKSITIKDIEPILPRSDLKSISDLVDSLINQNAKHGVEIINQLVSDGVDLERFNLDLIDYLRKIILVKTMGVSRSNLTTDLPEKIENKLIEQSEKLLINQLINFLEKFMAIQQSIKEAEIVQLPLEMAVIELTEEYESTESTRTPFDSAQGRQEHPSTPLRAGKNTLRLRSGQARTQEQSDQESENKLEISAKKFNNLTVKEIREKWSDVLKESKKINHILPLILQVAYPLEIIDNQLKLGFEFEIHIKKIQEQNCLKKAEEVLEKILGTNLIIKPVILTKDKIEHLKTEHQKNQPEADQNQLEKILQSFDGKLIK